MHQDKNELIEVGRSDSEWAVLYLDKTDGRYWELTYPSSSLHGAGVPIMESRSLGEITDKYKMFVPE